MLTTLATLADDRVDARQDRHRDPTPAAHRSPRGRRIFQRKAERLVGHAAQAQSGHLRTDLRISARGASERAGRIRERRALARARYLALLGRTHHHSRLHHARRLPAQQNGEPDGDHVRLSRAHAGEPGEHARPRLQRTIVARPGRERRFPRRRLSTGAGPRHARVERESRLP